MARLYSNEHFPFPVVEELRRLGHDVLTIQETGQANLPHISIHMRLAPIPVGRA
jgi:hypothetical protein